MNGNLARALRKAEFFETWRCWYGYFTPSEILALIADGHKPRWEKERYKSNLDYIIAHKKRGESNPMTFYFDASGKHRPEPPVRHDKTEAAYKVLGLS